MSVSINTCNLHSIMYSGKNKIFWKIYYNRFFVIFLSQNVFFLKNFWNIFINFNWRVVNKNNHLNHHYFKKKTHDRLLLCHDVGLSKDYVKYIDSIYIPYILSTKCVKLHHVMINFKIKDKLTESIFSDQLQEAILYFLRIAW